MLVYSNAVALPPALLPRRIRKDQGLTVVVVGSRELRSQRIVWRALDRAHRHKSIAMLVHGGSPGAEELAAEWAHIMGIRVIACPADWARDQETAALKRHKRMIEEFDPDGVIIFSGAVFGDDLAARAGAVRIPVWRPVLSSNRGNGQPHGK